MKYLLVAIVILLLLLAFGFTIGGADAVPVRGQQGDLWADIVVGQPDFGELAPNEVAPGREHIPWGGGVVVDRSTSPGFAYIWDGGNSRILGMDLGTCYATSPCAASMVIGQSSLTEKSGCNGDSNFQSYPARAPASASTLCGLREAQLSITEAISIATMQVAANGDLYVPDQENNRILRYTSPRTSDAVADEVWGQADFTGNACNRSTVADVSPTAQTLCLRYGGGVTLDSSGNLWVADNGNHRVLRFPAGSKTADLALGQPNLVTGTQWNYGSGLNQMQGPTSLRFDAAGRLYVADTTNNRVLRFTAPFSTGMVGEVFAQGVACPDGLEVAANGIWINDNCNSMVELWGLDGVLLRILGKATWGSGCATLCSNSGGLGLDALGNVLVSHPRYVQDVLRFPAIGFMPDKYLFGFGPNKQSASALTTAVNGMAVTPSQLIVADNGRILFWNNPAALTNGKPASGVIVPGRSANEQNYDTQAPWPLWAVKSDGQHLWSVVNIFRPEVWVYNLPLTTGALPFYKLTLPLPVLGGGTIDFSANFQALSIEPTPGGTHLWLSMPITNKVVRIRNPLTTPVVDAILGQTSPDGNDCNRGLIPRPNTGTPLRADASMLCMPGEMRLDKFQNLWVSDHWLEADGNWRMVEFNSFTTVNTEVIYASANRIIPMDTTTRPATWTPAFNSENRMVVGYNGYLGSRFPGIYNEPFGPNEPAAFLNDYFSMAIFADFDAEDNLYVADHNRGRVLVYKKPLYQPFPPTPTATQPPQVTPTATPAPEVCTPPNARRCR